MFNSADGLSLLGIVVGVFGACLTAVWTLSWWLSGQFTSMKDLLFIEIRALEKVIMGKLESHEKLDDNRFNNIRDDVWSIRMRNAAKDGLSVSTPRDKPVE